MGFLFSSARKLGLTFDSPKILHISKQKSPPPTSHLRKIFIEVCTTVVVLSKTCLRITHSQEISDSIYYMSQLLCQLAIYISYQTLLKSNARFH